MNNFEQKILNMKSSSDPNSDSEQFLSKLHGRIEESEQNKKTIVTSCMMIFVVGFLSSVLLTNEIISIREILGAVFVVSACFIDMFFNKIFYKNKKKN